MFRQTSISLFAFALLQAVSVSPASADAAFIKFLTGPWGQSTTSGEPVAEMIMKPGAPQFHRKSCPPEGVALKDMVPNEVWFGTLPDQGFVRISMSGSGKPVPQQLTFQKMDGPDAALFGFTVNISAATLKVTRLSPNHIRVNSELGPMKRESFYIRCKALAS
ncbi:MAG: hypothetical protein ACK4MV_13765 [Beijerinckiaceae bacterium]